MHKIFIYSGVIPSTTFIERAIESISKSGDFKIFLLGEVKSIQAYSNKNIKIIDIGSGWKKLSWLLKFLLLRPAYFRFGRLNDIVKKGIVLYYKPKIFHLQWSSNVDYWQFVQNHGIKLIVSLRGRLINVLPVVDTEIESRYKQFFKQVDAFHAVSGSTADRAMQYGADPNRIKVIYSGLDLEFLAACQKKNYNIANPMKILSVGRFNWQKGYPFALKLMHELKRSGLDFEYHLIAGNPDEEILYLLRHLHLEDHVQVQPTMDIHQIFEKMCNMDMLFLPSVEEGVANVVLEAMALGLPVVSSDCGGMKEVIQHKENGLLFTALNSDSAHSQIMHLKDMSPSERREMADKGKRQVEQQHAIRSMQEGFTEMYKSVI